MLSYVWVLVIFVYCLDYVISDENDITNPDDAHDADDDDFEKKAVGYFGSHLNDPNYLELEPALFSAGTTTFPYRSSLLLV